MVRPWKRKWRSPFLKYSAVNLIVGWWLFACSMKCSILCLFVVQNQIRVKMQLACFFNVLEWWLLIERNQRQWPHSRVLLAFAFHLARQPLYGNSIAPSGSSSCPFVDSTFFGYLLLVIVPRLFPFRHVARRNVARAIDWSEKKRTRNASLRARNSGLWRCGARDFFFSKLNHCL